MKTENKLERHALSEIFPELPKDQFEKLCEDIQENGQQVRGKTFQGKILDGWNRYLACKKLGIPFIRNEFKGSYQEAARYVMSINLNRRHLTDNQRYCIGAQLYKLIKKNKKDYVIHNHHTPKNKLIGTNIKERKSETVVANMLNISTASLGRAKVLMDRHPEMFEKCKNGEISVAKAYTESSREPACVIDGVKFPDSFSWHGEIEKFIKEITIKTGNTCIIYCKDGRFEAEFVPNLERDMAKSEYTIVRSVVVASHKLKSSFNKNHKAA